MSSEQVRTAIEAALPALAFTVVSSLHGGLIAAVLVAVMTTGVFTVWRLMTGERLLRPLIGLGLVAPAALTALLSGSAVNFFLPEIVLSGVAAAAIPILLLVGLPPAGIIVAFLTGSGMQWRHCDRRRRAYSAASLVLLVAAVLGLAIQLPFYLADSVSALGLARLALLPLHAVAVAVAIKVYRRVHRDHVCAAG